VLEEARELGADGVARGAYSLFDDQGGTPQIVIVATGGEVSLAIDARAELSGRGIRARVVSMPSWELFREQSADYRLSVLPEGTPRLAIEAGVTLGWGEIVGDDGVVIGIDRFGASAPGAEVAERLGLTVEVVVAKAVEIVEAN
jgi:transketolase